jgi:hypothetical protein
MGNLHDRAALGVRVEQDRSLTARAILGDVHHSHSNHADAVGGIVQAGTVLRIVNCN